MEYIYELEKSFLDKLPIFAKVDSLVVGAGVAGIAAATTLSEKKHKTLIIEKYGFVGGAATAGLSGTICGLFNTTDNTQNKKAEQIVSGFADRFYKGLKSVGGVTDPQIYGNTWVVTHDLLSWKNVGVSFLRDAGVNILFHTQVVGSIVEDEVFKGVVINTKSGFAKILANYIVDASGDADVIYRASLKTTKGKNGVIQNPTMIFKMANIDIKKYTDYWGSNTISPQKVILMLEKEDALPRKKVWLFPTIRDGELLINATKIIGFDGRALDVTNPVDHTEAELVSLEQINNFAKFMQKNIPGCENSYIVDSAVEVGIRQTRTIDGIATLKNEDVVVGTKYEDAIVKSAWPIELHVGDKPKVSWLKDDYYEVPYGTLVPAVGENIIVAGRCLSSEHEALASARVTAQCFGYGEAAAIAIDLSSKSGKKLRNLDGCEVREILNRLK